VGCRNRHGEAEDLARGLIKAAQQRGAEGGELFAPEGGMGLGPGGVEPAIVPEAAVDEDGESACAENEGCLYAKDFPFRAVGRPAKRCAPPPAGDAVGAKYRDEPQLGGRVAALADGRHDGGAFPLGENVGHGTERATGRRVDNRLPMENL
jgi:hypothetical protein